MSKRSSMYVQRQAGFTLIELIVVIVILGILAAVALPKFVDLGVDARVAALHGAGGAMESSAAMVHGKVLAVNPTPTTLTVEGVVVNITNTYPTANANFALGAGLKAADWTTIAPGTAATANAPVTSATEIAIIPVSVAGSPKGLSCYVKYAQAASLILPPTVTYVVSSC